MNGEDALARLIRGHARYLAGESTNPHRSAGRRKEVSEGQNPFAAILGCSDSRVSPAVVFDQGLGDIFVIRTAGHILDRAVLASLEFAVDQLGVSLILLLAHSECGAVRAAVQSHAHPSGYREVPGNLRHLVETIWPAIEVVRDQPGDIVENAVREHAWRIARQLDRGESYLASLISRQKTMVAVGYYDLCSGCFELLTK